MDTDSGPGTQSNRAGGDLLEALERDLAGAADNGRALNAADAALLRTLAGQIDLAARTGEPLNGAIVREFRQALKDADLDGRGANDSNADSDPLRRFAVIQGEG